MSNPFIVVIPARYDSSRFPGKVLADIGGKPMIQHVYERAVVSGAEQVVVATDAKNVADAAKKFNASVCMTSREHPSGSDRIAEVAALKQWPDDIVIVNVQGDEPLIPPENIAQVAKNLTDHPEVSMATLVTPFQNMEELVNPNNAKVVIDKNGLALYFSRSVVPYQRDTGQLASYHRHIGIYAYRVGFLQQFVSWQVAPLEYSEKLEQLRVLWYGEHIHAAQALVAPPSGVDTEEDLMHIVSIFEKS